MQRVPCATCTPTQAAHNSSCSFLHRARARSLSAVTWTGCMLTCTVGAKCGDLPQGGLCLSLGVSCDNRHCRYVIPGGSAGHYHREGYTFDVGSSMMFGMGQEGTTNLITRALSAVGKSLDTVPDPTQIHYHLPPSAAQSGVSLEVACSQCNFHSHDQSTLCYGQELGHFAGPHTDTLPPASVCSPP